MTEKKRKRSILFVSTLGAFLVPYMSSSVVVALPGIREDFGISSFFMSFIASAFLMAASLFVIPFGRLGDIFGRKKVYIRGVAVYTLASFFCAIAWNPTILIVFRCIQGIGAAAIFSNSVAILTSVFPLGERGKALGVHVASTYFGLSIGPLLGGLCTEYFGWRSIFYIVLPVGCLVLWMAHTKIKEEWGIPGEKNFDITGAILSALGIGCLMLGMTVIKAIVWGKYLFVLGIFVLIVFARVENKKSTPLLDVSIFKNNPVFRYSILATTIHYAASYAVGYLLSLHLQYVKGLSADKAGFILVFQPIMQMIFSPIAGKISDKVSPHMLSSWGMGLTCLGILNLTLIHEDTPLPWVIFCLMILGLGFAFFGSPNTNAVMSSVSKQQLGMAAGVLSTSRVLGQAASLVMATFIFSLFAGNHEFSRTYHAHMIESLRVQFLLFSGICIMGILFTWKSYANHKKSMLQSE